MKILFCGMGSIGKRHAEIISRKYEKHQIYTYKSSLSNNEVFLKYTNIVSTEELLTLKPEVAFITNPTSLHVETALKLLPLKCDLFIEKPLANNMNNVVKLMGLAKDSSIITLMGCNMRFNPLLLKLKDIVSSNIYGKPINFIINCGSYLPKWRPNQDYTQSYSGNKDLGGGVVFDLIHELDYTKWIFGKFSYIKAFSGKKSNLKINSDDFSNIIVETENFISGIIHLDYYRINPKRFIEVTFNEVVVIADLIKNEIIIEDDVKKELLTFDFDRNYTYEKQIEYFFHCIEKRQSTFNDIEEGSETLNYALSILKNSENKGSALK